jgi:hypothetical protein
VRNDVSDHAKDDLARAEAGVARRDVDLTRVTVQAPDRVEVPAQAVNAAVTFTGSNLGDSLLEHINGAWYITE